MWLIIIIIIVTVLGVKFSEQISLGIQKISIKLLLKKKNY